jgi:hypothetical protein
MQDLGAVARPAADIYYGFRALDVDAGDQINGRPGTLIGEFHIEAGVPVL